MDINQLKRWHWVVVGLIAGLALSYVWLGLDHEADMHINTYQFERLLNIKDAETGSPMLTNLVVHPPTIDFEGKKVQIVSGLKLVRVHDKQMWVEYQRAIDAGKQATAPPVKIKRVPFDVVMTVPFKAARNSDIALPPNATVGDFLKIAATNNKEIRYNYGWWQTPPAVFILWTSGAVIAIGGLWPGVLNVLIGAGFGPPKREDSGMGLFGGFGSKSKSIPMAKKADTSAADQAELDALNARLERTLADAGVLSADGKPASDNDDSTAGMKALTGEGATETPATMTEQELREYKEGEFYPVAKKTSSKKKTDA